MNKEKKVIRNFKNYILTWRHIKTNFNSNYNNNDSIIHTYGVEALSKVALDILEHKKSPENYDFKELEDLLVKHNTPEDMIQKIKEDAKEILNIQSDFYQDINGLRFI